MNTLDETTKQSLRRSLLEREAQLQSSMQSDVRKLRDGSLTDDGVPDSADLAASDLSASLNASALNADAQALEEVRAALKRLEEDQFGLCEDCGTQIGIARLRVNPVARRCTHCQQVFESQHALSRPSL